MLRQVLPCRLYVCLSVRTYKNTAITVLYILMKILHKYEHR